MRYCLNPDCPQPKNLSATENCQACGSSLTLHERFDILLQLGRGGFGAAFLAIDQVQPNPVHCVVKQFCPKNTEPEKVQKALSRFQREAHLLQKLHHPQLPHFVDYFEDTERVYLIQEYIHGVPLMRAVKKLGALSETDVKQMLRDFLPVLAHIHEHQVIHRDINPNNILYRTRDSQLVLIDFGLAADLSLPNESTLKTANSVFIGTAGYVPPENGKQPVPASDIFALGATCFYLLTGMPPKKITRDSTTEELLWKSHLQVSDDLSEIMDKMLRHRVEQRYQSALKIVEELNQVLIV
ncbi:serine/threonine protein kinase [Tolypothrix tenuis PCC 7101]|uniref:non-specific serine/threonine protein kinase n=2 Tax=Tolypothrix TaxID=111782 RepID=A0A1Z4N8B7_9CYAN|nr:serine/threonine protein kinase [Aulosira sp. FACHB-113]BAZ01961.1 serine/threonine protein kinase [Tolypothrix tenuis PCC 7101]BAZ74114.1 serine/threonine protein kinase [Aulosira laxa NIES-50]